MFQFLEIEQKKLIKIQFFVRLHLLILKKSDLWVQFGAKGMPHTIAETGFVYAFLTIASEKEDRILKIGQTSDWEKRRSAYMGANVPDADHFLLTEVAHAISVETALKRHLYIMFTLHSGYEWFIVPHSIAPFVIDWIRCTICVCSQFTHMQYLDESGKDQKALALKRRRDQVTAALDFQKRATVPATPFTSTDAPIASLPNPLPAHIVPENEKDGGVETVRGADARPTRRKRDDGTRFLGDLTDIRQLMIEYVGTDGKSGLRHLDAETNGKWKKGKKASRDAFTDKMFFYREIAGQARAMNSMTKGLDAVQTRLDTFYSQRHGVGWTKLLKVLQTEQPHGSLYKASLTEALADIESLLVDWPMAPVTNIGEGLGESTQFAHIETHPQPAISTLPCYDLSCFSF